MVYRVTPKAQSSEDKELIFEIEDDQGNVEQYFTYKQMPNKILLAYLRNIRKSKNNEDREAANAELLTKMLGEGVMDALIDSPHTTDDDIDEVFKIVFSKLENAKSGKTLGK